MKLIAALLFALVAVANCGTVHHRTSREVSQEAVDMVFDAFVTIYRTIVENYSQDLIKEIVHEVLEHDGAFNFSPELRSKLDDKRVELSEKLKVVILEIVRSGVPLPELIMDMVRTYLNITVDYMLGLTPFELMEAITKEIIANEGAFNFSPEVLAMIDDSKDAYKEGTKKMIDYGFEMFDYLGLLQDEHRQIIDTVSDYMIDRIYDSIPWELLEDTVYYVLSNGGSVDLSIELLDRIELTKDDLREQLRETLEHVEKLLLGEGRKHIMLV